MFRFIRTGFLSMYETVIRKGKRSLSALLPYQPMKGGREILNLEYSKGDWDYLRNLNELSRFSVVVGYCNYFHPRGKILEIGCGEGILQERLYSSNYERFVGVDISDEAIRRASQNTDEKTIFIREDATKFTTDDRFDIIIFNESLEYFRIPLSEVQRYERFLEENGVFIISMFVGTDTSRTKRIWNQLETVYTPKAETKVSTQPGFSWIIKVY
jgi:2-polyprenyl-3-methyl-5-hydroxy-6-metoxy-1,4-benzoquinol methylase